MRVKNGIYKVLIKDGESYGAMVMTEYFYVGKVCTVKVENNSCGAMFILDNPLYSGFVFSTDCIDKIFYKID